MKHRFYPQVEKFVFDTFKNNGDEGGIPHLIKTVDYVKILKPDADEALLIAAIAHDLERGVHRKETHNKLQRTGFTDPDFMKYHQEEGARIIAEYLRGIGAEEELVERVVMLVSKHEVGGNVDQNLLKDADSMSFFETSVEHFLSEKSREYGYEKVKEKLDWMYKRITDERARVMVEPKYEEAIKRLNLII